MGARRVGAAAAVPVPVWLRCTVTRWASASSSRCSATCASRPTTASWRFPKRGSHVARGWREHVAASRGYQCRACRSHHRRARPAPDALVRGFVDEVVSRADCGPTPTRRVAIAAGPPRPCAQRRPRCGRPSICRSRSGCGGKPTWRRPCARPAPSAPAYLRGCPRSRESSVRSRPVTLPRSTTSSVVGSSGRCRAASTSSGPVPASAATA